MAAPVPKRRSLFIKGTRWGLSTVCLLLSLLGCAHRPAVSLSPDRFIDAIGAGGAALPYFVYSKTSLPEINQAFKAAGLPVTVEDTYLAAFHTSFEEVPADGNTGQGFTNMETATRYLQNLLEFKGVDNHQAYLLTSIDTAISEGFILIAAVYRPENTVSVFNKFNFLARETLSPDDPAYFRAYRMDVEQNSLDIVYDWAALPVDCIAYQARQAVLLTLVANKIMAGKATTDYWPQERQWIAGNHLAVMIKQDLMVSQQLGLDHGFTRDLNLSPR